MSVTFTFAGTLNVKLETPTLKSRSLVRHLTASNKSLDAIMAALLSFLPDSDMCDPAEMLLAVEAVRQFYNNTLPTPTFDPALIDNMSSIAPILFPQMIKGLHLSFHCCPTAGGSHIADAPLISALHTLLQHESGMKYFAETTALTAHISVLIQLWISVSGSALCNPAAPDIVDIIERLYTYPPTREALTYVLDETSRNGFVGGLSRVLISSGLLIKHPTKFTLPTSLPTNMCGLGVLGRARPSLRRLFFHHGIIEALCTILRYLVFEHAKTTYPYTYALGTCKELSELLRCELSSSFALARALSCGLLETIVHAVAVFGVRMLTPCGTMPSILRNISSWCLKSRRIAIHVHAELAKLQNDAKLWKSLPSLPSQNELTVAFHEFLDAIGRTVVVSPVNAKIIVPCMNSKCDDKVCESKRYKRCPKCLAFVVCSRACFKAACKAGEHTPKECEKSPDDVPVR